MREVDPEGGWGLRQGAALNLDRGPSFGDRSGFLLSPPVNPLEYLCFLQSCRLTEKKISGIVQDAHIYEDRDK
jgi:hypothetical protein